MSDKINLYFGEIYKVGGGADDGSYDDGFSDGKAEGIEEGKSIGYADGFSKGEEAGFDKGYADGKEDGLTEGEDIGYNKGYDEGEAYGKANAPTENLNVTLKSNGTFNYPKPSDKYYADVEVVVDVPSEKTPTQEKSITIKENGTEEILPDNGFALHKVTVVTNIDTRLPEQTKEVTIRENGTTNISPDSGYTLAGVSVTTEIDTRLPEQEKSLEVTENKVYEVTPDEGYALSKVTVTGNVAGSGGGDDNGLIKVTSVTADEWDIYPHMETKYSSLIKITDWTEFNKKKHRNFKQFFYHYNGKELGLSSLDMSNAENCSEMFSQCVKITSLDLSNWNISNVTNMQQMFLSCEALTSLNLSNWNTSNVNNMSYMVYYCYELSNVTFGNNWASHKSISKFEIHNSPLSKASILDLANKIADKSDTSVYTGTQTVKLKTSQKSLFTEDELSALANLFTSKNWTLTWG